MVKKSNMPYDQINRVQEARGHSLDFYKECIYRIFSGVSAYVSWV